MRALDSSHFPFTRFDELVGLFNTMASKSRAHETDDEGSSKSTKDVPPVKKKKYLSHWRSDFSKTFPELRPSRVGTTSAHCTVCNSDFQIKFGGFNDCKKHVNSKSHKAKKAAVAGTLTSMFEKGRLSSANDLQLHFTDHESRRSDVWCDQTDRVDWVWHQLDKRHPAVQKLSCVMKGILTIPHSSAACERVFSMVRKTSTEQRSSLLQETTEALLVLKAKPGNASDIEYCEKDLQALKSAYYKSLNR